MPTPFPMDEHGEPKMPAEWRDPAQCPNFATFINDMLTIEIPVEVYFGGNGYVGPAVRTYSYAEEGTILRSTKARVGKKAVGSETVVWARGDK